MSEEQIAMAEELSKGMDIRYETAPAEQPGFPDGSFDVITACQCFWYFDHEKTAPAFHKLLRQNGTILLLCMAWLPLEDEIAAASEKLVLQFSPHWTGGGEVVHPIEVPADYLQYFEPVYHEEYRLAVPFTRESWHGRMRTCRGVGASLTEDEIAAWEKAHRKLLAEIAPERFTITHYAALTELRRID